MKKFILKYKVAFFFIIIYGFSLPFWILQIFINDTNLPLNIPITDIITAFTPLITSLILVYIEFGKNGIKNIMKRIFNYKNMGIKMLIIIIAIPVVIFTIIYTSLSMFYKNYLPKYYETSVVMLPFLLLFFLLGAIGEETGYMGFEYELLEKKYGIIKTALLIGIMWAVWHYPSMLKQGRDLKFFIWGTLGTISYRIIYVILFKKTENNLFVCILSHTLYNFFRSIFPNDEVKNPLIQLPEIHYSVIIIVTMIIIFMDKINAKRNCT
jgi:membrane protease YdiL (CAAX protease family)